MKGGFWLSDEQWQLIKPRLPYRAVVRKRVDDRRVISGIIHVLQPGCRWQDCPEEYGPPRRSTIAITAGRRRDISSTCSLN